MGGEAVNPAILRQQETAFLHHDLWRPFRVHPGRGKVSHKFFLHLCVCHLNPPVSSGMMVLIDFRAELNV